MVGRCSLPAVRAVGCESENLNHSPLSCVCPEPKFIGSFWVPESENPDDDKVFFFFRETAVEAQGLGKSTYSRIGQLCRVRRRFGRPTLVFSVLGNCDSL